jgi:hypothetical protein
MQAELEKMFCKFFFNDAGNFADKYLMIMEIFCHNSKENAL